MLPLALLLLAGGCPADDVPEPEPDFPADYVDSYVEVRNCRGSADHDLNNIRILASPSALEPYQNRMEPFPVDAVVLKEEYEFDDPMCEGPIKQWTVMRKLAEGSAPDTLDWAWQTVDLQRNVVDEDDDGCFNCHSGCGNPPDGYEGTCAIP
jgi:hypothetical protein